MMRKSCMSAHTHAERPIQADHFAIEHLILDDMLRKGRVLAGPAQTGWERNLLSKRDAGRLRQTAQQGSIENTWGDGHHANAIAGKLARNGQRHTDYPTLRGAVSGLPDLPIETRHRRGIDDDAALAAFVRRVCGHRCSGKTDN